MLLKEESSENSELQPGARDWIRTSTSLRTLPPEDSASTNFATRAYLLNLNPKNCFLGAANIRNDRLSS